MKVCYAELSSRARVALLVELLMDYEVCNGLNLGPDNVRFEPGDVISQETLEQLVKRKYARENLIARGYLCPLGDSSDVPDSPEEEETVSEESD